MDNLAGSTYTPINVIDGLFWETAMSLQTSHGVFPPSSALPVDVSDGSGAMGADLELELSPELVIVKLEIVGPKGLDRVVRSADMCCVG